VTTKVPDRLNNFLAQIEDAFRVNQERPPFRGQAHARLGPIEQAHAEFFLEILDLPRERGLGEVQLFRTPGKAESFAYRNEITKVTKLHDQLNQRIEKLAADMKLKA